MYLLTMIHNEVMISLQQYYIILINIWRMI